MGARRAYDIGQATRDYHAAISYVPPDVVVPCSADIAVHTHRTGPLAGLTSYWAACSCGYRGTVTRERVIAEAEMTLHVAVKS